MSGYLVSSIVILHYGTVVLIICHGVHVTRLLPLEDEAGDIVLVSDVDSDGDHHLTRLQS